jgi:hypothetical protein
VLAGTWISFAEDGARPRTDAPRSDSAFVEFAEFGDVADVRDELVVDEVVAATTTGKRLSRSALQLTFRTSRG